MGLVIRSRPVIEDYRMRELRQLDLDVGNRNKRDKYQDGYEKSRVFRDSLANSVTSFSSFSSSTSSSRTSVSSRNNSGCENEASFKSNTKMSTINNKRNKKRIYNESLYFEFQQAKTMAKTQSAQSLSTNNNNEENSYNYRLKRHNTNNHYIADFSDRFFFDKPSTEENDPAIARAKAAVERRLQDPETKVLRQRLENYQFP